MSSIGKERVEMLDTIRRLSVKSEYGLVSKLDLAKELDKTYNTVSVMLYRLHSDSLVDSPIRGYYKLTEKGAKILLECIGADMQAEQTETPIVG
jgi:Mn-dependent DtxR family transcriptional regulator